MQNVLNQIVMSFVTLRRTQGLKQEYIRDNWHVDVSNIENGRNYPSMPSYLKLCNCYKIDGGWLLLLAEMVNNRQLSVDEMNYIVNNWEKFIDHANHVIIGIVKVANATR
jgi:transcriptional regulator with XRE-family HTH domain